jgi:hypothetical protein
MEIVKDKMILHHSGLYKELNSTAGRVSDKSDGYSFLVAFRKVRGILFMLLNICFLSCLYICQKILLQYGIDTGNPINPNEWTYWTMLI